MIITVIIMRIFSSQPSPPNSADYTKCGTSGMFQWTWRTVCCVTASYFFCVSRIHIVHCHQGYPGTQTKDNNALLHLNHLSLPHPGLSRNTKSNLSKYKTASLASSDQITKLSVALYCHTSSNQQLLSTYTARDQCKYFTCCISQDKLGYATVTNEPQNLNGSATKVDFPHSTPPWTGWGLCSI